MTVSISSPWRARLVLVLFVGVAALLWALPAQAATIPVNITATAVVSDSFCSLAEAIISANTNSNAIENNCVAGSGASDTIKLVANTTYTASGDFLFELTALPAITSTMIISGNNSTVKRVGPDFVRLFLINPSGNLTLQKLTVRDGNVVADGGAIYNQGKLTLVNSKILSNIASFSGGGLYNRDGSITTLISSDVISNASSAGAGIYNVNSTLTILPGSHVARNQSSGPGGGLSVNGSTATIQGAFVTTNTATIRGGGLDGANSVVTIQDSFFLANVTDLESGGAIAASEFLTTTIINTTFAANRSNTAAGGAIYNSGSIFNISDSRIFSNTAGNGGGGLYNDNQSMTIVTNTKIISNSSGSIGGGIGIVEGGAAKVTDSKINENHATIEGGAIENHAGFLTVIDTDMLSNTTSLQYGGALYSRDSHSTFIGGTVGYNRAKRGGGLYIQGSFTSLSGVTVISNTAEEGSGGGILVFASSFITITDSHILSNSASAAGGGIYHSSSGTATINNSEISYNRSGYAAGMTNYFGSKLTVTDTDMIGNQAGIEAGALNNYQSKATFSGGAIASNRAGDFGGAFKLEGGTVLLDNMQFTDNSANIGGAIYVTGTLAITDTTLNANTGKLGAGLYVTDATVTLYQSKLLDNQATDNGGALHQASGKTSIAQSCIVGNSATAVNYATGDPIEAANNWWGAHNGPGGAGPGAGDTISANVNFAPILKTAVLDCPADAYLSLELSKAADKSNALVGETITYTYRITNTGTLTLTQVSAVDDHLGNLATLAGALNPHTSRIATGAYVVKAGDFPGPLVNTVIVTGTDALNSSITQSATLSIAIAGQAGLTITVRAGAPSIRVGDHITFTYYITNTGTLPLHDLKVNANINGGTSAEIGSVDTLTPTASFTATQGYDVQPGDIPGSIAGSATVTAKDSEDNAVTASTGATVPVVKFEIILPSVSRQEPSQ